MTMDKDQPMSGATELDTHIPLPFIIETLDDADRALYALADRMRQIQALEAQAEADIERITAQKVEQAKPIHDEILDLEAHLANFLEGNKAQLFTDRDCKSMKLNHGTIGFRESTKIKACNKTLKLVMDLSLQDSSFKDAMKVKTSLNKENMKNWSDEKLRQVEAKKLTEDVPYYETKEFSIKDL